VTELLHRYFTRLGRGQPWRWQGKVLESVGQTIESAGPLASVGECCEIRDREGRLHLAEVIGFRGSNLLSMPIESSEGIRFGDPVASSGAGPEIEVGPGLIGRVLNALGAPIDGLGLRPAAAGNPLPLDAVVRAPLDRAPIRVPLGTGIRAIDALLTVGRGQRVGIFGGSGVGKSTLIGMMTRNTEADITVVGLVGERGREVGEFLERSLGAAGRPKSVVVVATSDVAPLERLRAAQVATAYAEHFRDAGKRVLLLVDSVTRFARAQREVGLASGEPPARRGYPPSVFATLPRLLERAGQSARGSITAIYTVLVEGGDMDEPIADEVRGILDGHIVLDRGIASRGRYPAVDVTVSLSRVMDTIVAAPHRDAARRLRALVATYEAKRDLVTLGAYAKGSDRELDDAIARMPRIEAFLKQDAAERSTLAETVAALGAAVR